jgi:tetratricopeptide (TPR) repeat protein
MFSKLVTALSLVTLLTGSVAVVEAGWDEGVAAFKAGNYAQAAKEFQGVVEQQPDVYQGHLMLGQVLLKLNRDQEALTHLRKAFELDPSNVQVQLTLGRAYLDLGRHADAGAILGKINASSLPKNQQAVLHRMLATAFEKSGDSDRAMAELAKAARANPNDANLQYKYGALALNAGDTGVAISALEKASQLDPNSQDIKRAYARALVRRGRETTGNTKTQTYAKAAGVAQSLASANGSYENYMLLGDARLGAKQYDQAIAAYQQAAGKNASDSLPARIRPPSGNSSVSSTRNKRTTIRPLSPISEPAIRDRSSGSKRTARPPNTTSRWKKTTRRSRSSPTKRPRSKSSSSSYPEARRQRAESAPDNS